MQKRNLLATICVRGLRWVSLKQIYKEEVVYYSPYYEIAATVKIYRGVVTVTDYQKDFTIQ